MHALWYKFIVSKPVPTSFFLYCKDLLITPLCTVSFHQWLFSFCIFSGNYRPQTVVFWFPMYRNDFPDYCVWSRQICFFRHPVTICIGCCGNDLDVCMYSNWWCDFPTQNENNKLPSRWKCVLSVYATGISCYSARVLLSNRHQGQRSLILYTVTCWAVITACYLQSGCQRCDPS